LHTRNRTHKKDIIEKRKKGGQGEKRCPKKIRIQAGHNTERPKIEGKNIAGQKDAAHQRKGHQVEKKKGEG
jgi:hypothetical protein